MIVNIRLQRQSSGGCKSKFHLNAGACLLGKRVKQIILATIRNKPGGIPPIALIKASSAVLLDNRSRARGFFPSANIIRCGYGSLPPDG